MVSGRGVTVSSEGGPGMEWKGVHHHMQLQLLVTCQSQRSSQFQSFSNSIITRERHK